MVTAPGGWKGAKSTLRHLCPAEDCPLPPPDGTPVPHPSAGSNEFSFDFTYNIDANGIFTTLMVPGSFSGKILTGPRAGQTYTVDNLSFSGLVSGDNKIIDVSTITPQVETVTYSDGYVRQQICHRSRVHVFLGHSTDRHEKADGHNSDHRD